jgi:hypothetical protein
MGVKDFLCPIIISIIFLKNVQLIVLELPKGLRYKAFCPYIRSTLSEVWIMENRSFYHDCFWKSMVFEGLRFQHNDTSS